MKKALIFVILIILGVLLFAFNPPPKQAEVNQSVTEENIQPAIFTWKFEEGSPEYTPPTYEYEVVSEVPFKA